LKYEAFEEDDEIGEEYDSNGGFIEESKINITIKETK
jgi:hypothetical protein